jgi:hypothetical protein
LTFDRSAQCREIDAAVGELADDKPFEAGRSEKLLGLRIERGEVEGDGDIGLAVVDFELDRGERVQG